MKTIFKSGTIKRRINSAYEEVAYDMILLDEYHLVRIMDLEKTVIDNLENPTLCEFVSRKFMRNQFGKEGLIIGVIVEKKVVAFCVIYFPGIAIIPDDNLGMDIDLHEDELHKVAHIEVVMVHPAYRGNSLALQMNMQAIKLFRELSFHHICATVSPNNYPSVLTFFNTGLVIKALKKKYGGKLRYIFYQNLNNPNTNKPEEERIIQITDIKPQQEVLEHGFYGYKIRKHIEEPEIIYVK